MTAFPHTLSSHSVLQLNELLQDDEKLNQMIHDTEEMKGLQQSKEMTLATNHLLAEQNLKFQPRLEHQKNELIKRYWCLQEIFDQMRRSTTEHKSGKIPLDTLLALLQAEGAKIEEETENMAESFLDAEVPLDTFIDEYQSKRTLAHLRRVKIDKLQEMVLRRPQIAPASSQCSQDPPSRPAVLQTEVNDSPIPKPRRTPPHSPVKVTQSPAIQPPATISCPLPASPTPPTSLYPLIPPRAGNSPSLIQGYPSIYMQQYSTPVPHRPPPHLTPHPGFIMQ